MTTRILILSVALLAALLAAGCSPPVPSGGEPKPLPPGRIPKGYGPDGK
jgi:hypothetical protein